MKVSLLTACIIVFSATAQAATDGEHIYKQTCSSCHGRLADRKGLDKAPPLISLSRNEIVEGLTARRDGKIVGRGNKAKAHLTDDDIQKLADHIESLKAAKSKVP
ncbi:cytochrome [Yersinia enterocolitica]|uniref:c-type cytochrome n=1 Tax=Yersinia enterocolitica TaxID=630 RepID=UPI000281997D|nr:cytochrome c [Yersinia enterocolitica]AJI82075.1 cytochrome c family protein [Yersinia enterocolitica]EKA28116.1 putative cytochrome [Yersinia enterocolitica subsp. enterocolitica WA-314]KGA71163.1 cytochrome c family protein [Yersinia enterocolitica]PNM11277.1 cytochrome [Yersinia enterocolitica]CNJ54421.1 putative cytochrome [Yersinia enterocolitica]